MADVAVSESNAEALRIRRLGIDILACDHVAVGHGRYDASARGGAPR